MSRQVNLRSKTSPYGQTILVTGASSGIGLAITRQLVQQGFTVYAASRFMSEAASSLISRYPELEHMVPVKLDVQEEAACTALVARIASERGELAAVFHCAGAGIAGAVEETEPADARWQMDLLFFGTVHVVRPALTVMRRQGKGLVVLISSVAGSVPVPFQTYYSAAKAAVLAFAAGTADEMRPHGVRISVVSPGDTRTGFTDARRVHDCVADQNSPYAARLTRSVARMARDEQNCMSPEAIARAAIRNLYRRWPPLNQTPCLMYKAIMLLQRILPTRIFRFAVRLLYA